MSAKAVRNVVTVVHTRNMVAMLVHKSEYVSFMTYRVVFFETHVDYEIARHCMGLPFGNPV